MTSDLVKRLRRDSCEGSLMANAADRIEELERAQAWRPIETMQDDHDDALLYFPARTGRNALHAMVQIGVPAMYPHRPPTHWLPLPTPPEAK